MNSRDNAKFRSIVDSRAFVSVNKSRTGMSESKSATLDSIVEHEVLQKVESEDAGSNLVRIENPSRRLSVDSNIALRRMPTFVRTYREVEWKRVSKSFKSRRASEGCFTSNLSGKFETLDRDYSQDAEIHQYVNGKHIIRKRVPIFLSTERPGSSQRYASDDLVPVTSPAWNARGKCLIIKNLSSKQSSANLLFPPIDNYAEESSGQDDDDEDGDDDEDDSEESTDYSSHFSQASNSLSSRSPSPVGLSLPRQINIRSPNLRRKVLKNALHKNAPLADSLNGIFNNEISEFQVKPEENTVYIKNADITRDGTQQLHIAVDNNMNTIDKRDSHLVILPKDMGASVHLRIPTPYSVRTINVPTKLGKDFMCLKANYHLGSDEIAVARWPVATPSADCLLLCSTLIPKSGAKDSSTKLTPDTNFIKKYPESVTSRISPRHDTVITEPGNKVNVNNSETEHIPMYSQYHMSALPKSDYDKACTQMNPRQSVSLSHSREPPQPRIESPSEKFQSLAGKSAIWNLLLESLVTLSVASDKPLACPLTTDKPR
ncbi:hypothetical protein BgiMline_032291 [Biomphalaria glabrata]|nr:hypothetical protein BgiMline_028836 [Biomphalaria glabrata]